MRLRAIAATLAVLAALAGVSACGSSSGSDTTSHAASMSDRGIGAPGAKVRFTTPTEASVVGPTVVAKVKLRKFKLAPKKVGQPAVQGEGHLHFSLDHGKFDFPKYSGANGRTAVKLGVQGKYSPSTTRFITYQNLPSGTHELEVYLANNDHTNTGVATFVSFIVKGNGPTPSVPKGGGGGY
jgi:hypothetical protein